MPSFEHDEYEFDIGSERYRHETGRYLAGPPRDFDTSADRFRDIHGENRGQFKSSSSFGPDDERSPGPEVLDIEFGGRGGSRGQAATDFGGGDEFGLGDVGVSFAGL